MFELIKKREGPDALQKTLQMFYKRKLITQLLDEPNEACYTLLHVACFYDDVSAAEILLEWVRAYEGASMEMWVNTLSRRRGEEFAPLHLASFRGNI